MQSDEMKEDEAAKGTYCVRLLGYLTEKEASKVLFHACE
jgi:hypothetical protein